MPMTQRARVEASVIQTFRSDGTQYWYVYVSESKTKTKAKNWRDSRSGYVIAADGRRFSESTTRKYEYNTKAEAEAALTLAYIIGTIPA